MAQALRAFFAFNLSHESDTNELNPNLLGSQGKMSYY